MCVGALGLASPQWRAAPPRPKVLALFSLAAVAACVPPTASRQAAKTSALAASAASSAARPPLGQPTACHVARKRLDFVAFSPDGELLVTAAESDGEASSVVPARDGSLDVWSARSGAHVATLDLGAPRRVASRPPSPLGLAWTLDGRRLVSGGEEGDGFLQWAKVWDRTTWQERAIDARAFPCDVAVSRDGRRGAVVGLADQLVVFDLATGAKLLTRRYDDGHVGRRVAFASEGNVVIVFAEGHGVEWRRVADGAVLATLPSPGGEALSPREDLLAASDRGAWTGIVDAKTGRKVRAFAPVERAERLDFVWSPDAARVAGVSGLRAVQIWDAASGARVGGVTRSGSRWDPMLWSPDSKLLAMGDVVIDGATGATVRVRADEAGRVLAWAGARAFAVSHAALGGGVVLEDAATGAVTQARGGGPLLPFDGDSGLQLSPDRALVVSTNASQDGLLHVLRVRDGARLDVGASKQGALFARRDDGAWDGPDGAEACFDEPPTGRPRTPGLFAEFVAARSDRPAP